MNLFHKSAEFVAKHLPLPRQLQASKGHHHLALASLALVLAGTGAYIYRQEIAQAATYTFTQASWMGGETANTAVHPTNQNSWSQYASTSADTIADANGVRLGTVSYSFTDDGTATTTSPIATGGGFGSGAFSGTSATSSNNSIEIPSNWTSRTSAANNAWTSVTYGNGLFVAVASSGTVSNKVMTSPDGITWTSRTSPVSNSWQSVTYGNGLFVAVASSGAGALIMTSPDGITWTSRTHPAGTSDWRSVTYGNGIFVAVSVSGTSKIMRSSDGITWTTSTSPTTHGWNDVAYGNGVFVAVTSSGTTVDNRIMTSPDGTTWATSTIPANINLGEITYGLVGTQPLFVTAEYNPGYAFTSPDGINWTSRFGMSFNGLLDLSYGNGLFVALGYNAIKVSSDGITWTARTSAAVNNWTNVTYGNGLFVAVADSGTNNRVMTAPRLSSGTFTSNTIDLGLPATFTALSFASTTSSGVETSCTISSGSGCAIKIQIATSTSAGGPWNFSGPDGSSSTYFTSHTGGSTITTTAFNGSRYLKYQATLSTDNALATPTLDSVTINYTQYASSGDLTSSKYDVGADSVISRLSWTASTSTTETVRFQVQSSPDNSIWSGWCGYSDTGPTCDGTNYFTDAHNGVTLGTSNPLRSTTNGGLADRYFQYRVELASGGAVTPELTEVIVQYVLNAPPLAGNVIVSQITDPLDANYGKVSFSFEVSDEDTSSGSPENQYKLTPTLYQYSTDGVSFSTISSGLGANAYSVINLSGDSATTTTSVLWTPHSDIALTSNAKIRVTVTDGEAANFSATATSGTFSLDTTAPVVASVGGFLVDSSVGGAGLAGIKLFATDSSTMQYRLCNNSDFSDDGLNSGPGACTEWSVASASVDLTTSANSWNTVLGADSTEKVYMEVRDLYGNVTSRTATAPAMPPSFIATDTTNLNSDTYREFLSWGKASSTTFGSYKVYYNTTGSGASYSLLGTVTDVNQNYYTHTITTATSSTHYYKMNVVSANGDISEFTSVKSDVPDGSGSTDVTAPYIPYAGIAVSSVRNTSANITFSTYTDVSLAEGELATSTVRYASYTGTAPTSCPNTSSTNSNTYVVNHSIYLTDLTPSTNYAFCVLAKDISGNVSTATYLAESGGTFTTIGGPRITGVTQREVTDTSATIFWNTDTSSDSKVYFSTSAGGVNGATPVTGAVVTTSGTRDNETFYQHQIGLTGLTPGLTYYYKVSSTDALDSELVAVDDNTGQYYSFVTLKDTTPPTIMGTSTPVLAPDSAVIVWQTNELASTKVEYGLTDSYGTISEDVSDPLSIYHVRALTALTKETLYYYRVTSKDAANNSATATGTFTTPADGNVTITVVRVTQTSEGTPPDTTAPAISNVKVTDITPFGATVSFDTNEDAVSFVEYGKSVTYGDSSGSKAWSKTHSIKLRGLTLGTEYFIKVSAVDKAGNTGTGGEQTFKTTFLSENLKDMANVENIEQFQKEIESAIESILPSLVPPFITKPIISDITENGAKISFRTNIKAFPVVVFAEDGVFDETKENPYTGEMSDTTEKATSHEIALTGLKGNTKYHIQARGFSLPRVIGKSADVTFITKASKIAGSIVERKKDSFTVVWTTEEPTSSIVEFKDLKRGITGRKTDDAKKKSHSMKIENLPSGTAYEVNLSGVTEQGNIAEAGSPISVTTSTDVTAPVISGFKVDNALVPGRTDRIQTIVTWVTDEPSDSTVYYQEGAGSPGDTEELANKNEVLDSYITNHSVILPSLKPGTIYRLKVTSRDDSGNLGSFGPRTVITPKQTESITDIIFKNFEDSFKFLRKI